MSELSNWTPGDRAERMTMSVLVYRDGEDGVDLTYLLEAIVNPAKIRTLNELKAVLATGAGRLLKCNGMSREVWQSNGEELSLLDLADNGLLTALVNCVQGKGLRWLTMSPLTIMPIDITANLIPE